MVVEVAETEGFEHFRRAGNADVLPKTTSTRPGDFILTHGSHWTSRLISFGQMLRFRGKNRKYAYWNHAALMVGENGEIIEALGPAPGVVTQNVSKYARREYTIVRVKASREDRDESVIFARACVGEKYDGTTIVSIALSLITGTRFSFGFDGQMICSGLVARALERTRAIFEKEPSHIMPADLARVYKVDPPFEYIEVISAIDAGEATAQNTRGRTVFYDNISNALATLIVFAACKYRAIESTKGSGCWGVGVGECPG